VGRSNNAAMPRLLFVSLVLVSTNWRRRGYSIGAGGGVMGSGFDGAWTEGGDEW
jgi:hypothetical protein